MGHFRPLREPRSRRGRAQGVMSMHVFYAWLIWWALHFAALAIYLTRTGEEAAAA